MFRSQPILTPSLSVSVLETTVETLVMAEVEVAIGFDLDPELYVEYTGVPCILADSVTEIEEN